MSTTGSTSSSVPYKKKHLQNITNISRPTQKKFSPKKPQSSLYQYRVKSPSSNLNEGSSAPGISVQVTVPLTIPVPPSMVVFDIVPPSPVPAPAPEAFEPFLPNFPAIVISNPFSQKKKEKTNDKEPTWKQQLEKMDHSERDKENEKQKTPKRVYSKEQLLSLRANTLSMAPPNPLPSQIIEDYNKVWAKREQEELEAIRRDFEHYSISNPKISSSASAWKAKKASNQNLSPYSSYPSSPSPSAPASCPSTIIHPTYAPRSPTKFYSPNTTEAPSPPSNTQTMNETYEAIFNSPFTPPPASPTKISKKQTPQQSPWESSCDESSDGEYQWVIQELSARRLETRQKQIDIGKNTTGYQSYVLQVPKEKRKRCDPQTPNIYQVCSKRSWDGQIRKWRRLLHKYDPPGTTPPNMASFLSP